MHIIHYFIWNIYSFHVRRSAKDLLMLSTLAGCVRDTQRHRRRAEMRSWWYRHWLYQRHWCYKPITMRTIQKAPFKNNPVSVLSDYWLNVRQQWTLKSCNCLLSRLRTESTKQKKWPTCLPTKHTTWICLFRLKEKTYSLSFVYRLALKKWVTP